MTYLEFPMAPMGCSLPGLRMLDPQFRPSSTTNCSDLFDSTMTNNNQKNLRIPQSNAVDKIRVNEAEI